MPRDTDNLMEQVRAASGQEVFVWTEYPPAIIKTWKSKCILNSYEYTETFAQAQVELSRKIQADIDKAKQREAAAVKRMEIALSLKEN